MDGGDSAHFPHLVIESLSSSGFTLQKLLGSHIDDSVHCSDSYESNFTTRYISFYIISCSSGNLSAITVKNGKKDNRAS